MTRAKRTNFRLALVLTFLPLFVRAESDALYKIKPGPLDVEVADGIVISDAVQQRDVTFRIMYPAGGGPFPVVVFSSGGFCPPQNYDRITGHWVSHGYVVVAPNHRDSPNNATPPSEADWPLLMPARIRDTSLALDVLEELSRRAGIDGRVDGQRVAIGGHSFGAVIASMKTGLHVRDEYRDRWGDAYDDRFDVAVLLSAPGTSPELADNAFEGLRTPLIATGGTEDVGRMDPGDLSPADWRRQAYLLAPPGDKYSVIVEGADHYLGGLICNPERGGEDDPGAVAIVRAMTTAFLDAYLREDPDAREFLRTADVAGLTQGRADYRRR